MYLNWSIKQLLLMYYQPTVFRSTNALLTQFPIFSEWRARSYYMIKMLPLNICTSLIILILSGSLWSEFQSSFDWPKAFTAMLIGCLFGCVFGVTFAISGGVIGGIALGTSLGFTIGTSAPTSSPDIVLLKTVIAVGISGGAAVAVAIGRDIYASLKICWGLALSVGISSGIILLHFGSLFALKGALLTVGGVISVFFVTFFRIPTYPIDYILSLLISFRLIYSPQNRLKTWQLHPISWNETVWLRVPRLTTCLIHLIMHHRQSGLDILTFVSAQRPLQRKAAAEALIELALFDLRIATLSDIVETRAKIAWIHSKENMLPPQLMIGITTIESIAAHIEPYTATRGHYRRIKIIDNALNVLKTATKTLIARQDLLSSRVLEALQSWHPILQLEYDCLLLDSRGLKEIPQIYNFGKPLRTDEAAIFAGRKDIVLELENTLMGDSFPSAVLVYGSRRMGKSSLLNHLPRLLSKNFWVVNIDCQFACADNSLPVLIFNISRAITERAAEHGLNILALARAQLSEDTIHVFDTWLIHLRTLLPKGVRILVCFDEYEAINLGFQAENKWAAVFLNYTRHIQQYNSTIILLFSGVKSFVSLGPEWTTRFVSARPLRVGFLTADELIPILTCPVPDFNLRYDPGALEHLLELSAGHPFVTQALARELVDLLNDQMRHTASILDVDIAADKCVISAENYFANLYFDAKPEGQRLLHDLLTDTRVEPKQLTLESRLQDLSILNLNGDIAIPLFAKWLRSRIGKTSI